MNMKLTKGLVTRAEAVALAPNYVAFIEGDWSAFDKVFEAFSLLRKGNSVLTYSDGQFVRATISSIKHNDIRAIDGPVVRVSTEEYSWRVDGNRYATMIL